MYANSNSLYTSPLPQNVNPFALAGLMQNTMTQPWTNAFQGIAPQSPTWLQSSPQQQIPPQFGQPNALALQLAAQQLAQQLAGQQSAAFGGYGAAPHFTAQQSNPALVQQILHQLAQCHYALAQQLTQLATIPIPQGMFANPYPNQFIPGPFGPNFAAAGTLH